MILIPLFIGLTLAVIIICAAANLPNPYHDLPSISFDDFSSDDIEAIENVLMEGNK